MFDNLQFLADGTGNIASYLIFGAISIIPIKIGASMAATDRSDWVSCAIASFLSVLAAMGVAIFVGGFGIFGGLIVQVIIISAVLGTDVFVAIGISVASGIITSGVIIVWSFFVASLV